MFSQLKKTSIESPVTVSLSGDDCGPLPQLIVSPS